MQYTKRAEFHRSRSSQELGEAVDELQDRCNIEQMRLELEAKEDKQKALLSSVKFDSGDFEVLDRLFNSEAFSSWKHVSELRAQAIEAPPLVSQAMMNELSEIRLWDSDPGVPRLGWMAFVCDNREAFSNSAFASRDGGAKHYYVQVHVCKAEPLLHHARTPGE